MKRLKMEGEARGKYGRLMTRGERCGRKWRIRLTNGIGGKKKTRKKNTNVKIYIYKKKMK